MALTRKRHFDYTARIDDQDVRLKIKRLTVPEFEEFQAMFVAMGQGRGAPTAADETPDATRALLSAEVAYLKANAEWLRTVFDQYVTVVAGDVLDEDDEGNTCEVTNGRQFADMYAGHSALSDILARIWIENKLTETQKKKLPSRSASAIGSNAEPDSAAAGATPDPTVSSVEPETCAGSEAVTAPFNGRSCGTTVQ